jgi:hypothetical protein
MSVKTCPSWATLGNLWLIWCKTVENGRVTSLRKGVGVQALFMHCGIVGGDLTTCIVTVPALAVRTFEVAWVPRWRIDVRLTEKTGSLDEGERELS